MRILFTGFAAWALTAQSPQPLTLEHLLAKARPTLETQHLDQRLLEGRRTLAETRGLLREAPTVALGLGPRRGEGSRTTDRSVEVDLPLFLDHKVRARLEQTLGEHHPLLREAVAQEARLELTLAYLDAWAAQRTLDLRRQDLDTVSRWHDTARARVDSGHEPPFQAILAASDLLKARQELVDARAAQLETWARLRSRVELPPTPHPLADPAPLGGLPPGPIAWEATLPGRALKARLALEIQSLALGESMALSRWSLRGSHAQEGEERVTRIGIAWRLPRVAADRARRAETQHQQRILEQETLQAQHALESRLHQLRQRLSEPTMNEPDWSQALTAVEARLTEGRDRPSEALPLRRQLLDAQLASLRQQLALHRAAAEWSALVPEVRP